YIYYQWRNAIEHWYIKSVRFTRILLIIFLLLMMALPFIWSRFGAVDQISDGGQWPAWIGFGWMGVVSLWIVFDSFFRVLIKIGQWRGYLKARLFKPHFRVVWVTVLIAFLTIYGVWEAYHVRLSSFSITTEKALIKPIRIAHISDVHMGFLMRQGWHQQLIKQLEDLQPDIILSSGDFTDRGIDSVTALLPLWQQLTPPLGKFAVTGNHEVLAGLDASKRFLTQAGFQLLQDEVIEVGGLQLVGVHDPRVGRVQKIKREQDVFKAVKQDQFTILLKHRPWVDSSTEGLFDLQLSGHSHGGQIFPFALITALVHDGRSSGWFILDRGSQLYINRGTGTWGPPIRIAAAPEIALITITSRYQ
ncbi:metallophosphoesterase, partial [Magnetococcales bacterium HHB-1]